LRIRLAEDDEQLFPAGTVILALEGVYGHDGRGLRLVQKEALRTVPVRVNRVVPAAGSDLRIVGLNLHNYFNGDGHGGGFPTARGAATPAEFARQRGRLSATIKHLRPHLVAVMELENDGFGEDSAAADFIRDLEKASGKSWQAVTPREGPVGGDAITVGIFYRPDKLVAAGEAAVLTGPHFSRLNRVPIAQQFIDPSSGESFMIVVNHLKSKSSCPDDGRNANLKDGQGCWNHERTEAATVMARWTRSLAETTTAGKALILGDMNAYRMEDPIAAILDTGFQDLKASSGLRLEFSYIFGGEAGTLDYAFASPQLRPHVQSAMVPNINSPYTLELDLPLPWLGSSDHDPVLVDLRFRQPVTSD
jgi:predicted extracellular nuclease